MTKIMFVNTNINLSVLIPSYNWDIYDLVTTLNNLCLKDNRLNLFEIICVEDGSSNRFSNKEISQLPNTKYGILPKNIGRSKIRNMMTKKAKHEWLLFIDSDSKIENPFFISRYIDCIIKHLEITKNKNNDLKKIYYGSTIYSNQKPSNEKMLHWKYGSKIESKRKNANFSSHHFLIQKEEFEQNHTQFDEKILSYGYEDVFFIITNKLKPVYIKNPAHHIGIKTTKQFINNTESALKNLIFYSKGKIDLEKRIKIIKVAKIISRFYLTRIIIILFQMCKAMIVKNLYSNNPSLLLFQFYKLGYFLKEKNNLFSIKKS